MTRWLKKNYLYLIYLVAAVVLYLFSANLPSYGHFLLTIVSGLMVALGVAGLVIEYRKNH